MPFKSILPVALIALGVSSCTTGPVRANEHIVLILESAYSPQMVSVQMGDTVRFVNASGGSHALSSAEGIWSTDPIEDGAEITLQIEQAMTGRFYGWTDDLIEGWLALVREPIAE